MTRSDRQVLARRVASAVPVRLSGVRRSVVAAAVPALAEAYEAGRAEGSAEVPVVEGHVHEPAWSPVASAYACERRLPGGGRCPVRFRAYLPASQDEAARTTGEHAWCDFDEADVATPNGTGAAPPNAGPAPSDEDLGAGEEHAP